MMVNPEYVLFLCQAERIILNESLIGISCHHIMSYIKVIKDLPHVQTRPSDTSAYCSILRDIASSKLFKVTYSLS